MQAQVACVLRMVHRSEAKDPDRFNSNLRTRMVAYCGYVCVLHLTGTHDLCLVPGEGLSATGEILEDVDWKCPYWISGGSGPSRKRKDDGAAAVQTIH